MNVFNKAPNVHEVSKTKAQSIYCKICMFSPKHYLDRWKHFPQSYNVLIWTLGFTTQQPS